MKLKQFSAPVKVNLELTPVCNWKCMFCGTSYNSKQGYNYIKSNENRKHPDLNKVKKIIDALAEAQVFALTLTGGEIFTYPEIIKVFKYAYEKDFKLGFISNMSLLDKNKIREIARYTRSCSFSIHGREQTHDKIVGIKGAYKSSLENVILLNKQKFKATMLFTCTSMNTEEILYLPKIMDEFGVSSCRVAKFICNDNDENKKRLSIDEKQMDILIKRLIKINKRGYDVRFSNCFSLCFLDNNPELFKIIKTCGAGTFFGSVNYLGDLKFCTHMNWKLGNVLETPVKKLWNKKIMKKYRSLKWMPEQCKNCENLIFCKGGCKASFNTNRLKFGKSEALENVA